MFSEPTSTFPMDIDITLTFLQSIPDYDVLTSMETPMTPLVKPMIDPQSPLTLSSSKFFVLYLQIITTPMLNLLQSQSINYFGPVSYLSYPKYQRKYHHLFPPKPQSTHHYRFFLA